MPDMRNRDALSKYITDIGFKINRDAYSVIIANKGDLRLMFLRNWDGFKVHYVEIVDWSDPRNGKRKWFTGSMYELKKYIKELEV